MQLLTTMQLAILAITTFIANALPTGSQPQLPAVVSFQQLHEPGMTPPTGGGQQDDSTGNGDDGGGSGNSPKLLGFSQKPLNRTLLRNGTTTTWGDANGTDGRLIINNGGIVFGQKCRQVTLLGDGKKGGSILQATCVDDGDDRTWWLTSLNLNQCIGLNGGRLVFEERGNYDKTCRPCGIDADVATARVVLRCNCLSKQDGSPTFAELLLADHGDSGIKSVNGRLVCGGHEGTKSPSF